MDAMAHKPESGLSFFKIIRFLFFLLSLSITVLALIEMDVLFNRINDSEEQMEMMAAKMDYLESKTANCYQDE